LVCTVDNLHVGELSGVVTTAGGYVSHNDSNFDPSAIRIFFLSPDCKLTKTISYPTAARDPEDIAQAPDGTLWVADIGDNFTNPPDARRKTIALWRLPPGGRTPQIYRLSYPDGPHDAEALVLAGDGTPVIVTKEPLSPASIYVPTGPLRPDTADGVPLRLVGTFRPQQTNTPNPFGLPGEIMVTGGANSPDGKRVVLRTYADAYEWDVPDGDVVKAITTGTPRITPLPNEPQGEGIAYTRDGRFYVTVSDQPMGQPTKILRYPAPVVASPTPLSADGPTSSTVAGRWWDRLTSPRGLAIATGVVALGLLLFLAGLAGVHRSRRRPTR
jgi:hypothetical protein